MKKLLSPWLALVFFAWFAMLFVQASPTAVVPGATRPVMARAQCEYDGTRPMECPEAEAPAASARTGLPPMAVGGRAQCQCRYVIPPGTGDCQYAIFPEPVATVSVVPRVCAEVLSRAFHAHKIIRTAVPVRAGPRS